VGGVKRGQEEQERYGKRALSGVQYKQLTRDARIDPPIQLLNLLSAFTVDEISFSFMLYQQTT